MNRLLLSLLLLSGCSNGDEPTPIVYEPVEAGAPIAGAAESYLELPVGTPLGGFSTRCSCLGGTSRVDRRESAYAHKFVPSAGVQTHPTIKVIWLEIGNDHLVITKTDSIYSFDKLVESLEQSIGEATGLDLRGKVVHTTNHSHSSYGGFSDALHFYLGSDSYNEETFQRMAMQITDTAVEAFENRQPAKLGLQTVRDWDPDNRIYRDRRGINDELQVWPDQELPNKKDPRVSMLRVDALDDTPIAFMFNYGMHGIALSEASPMVSSDTGGGVEFGVQEQFDSEVVVMFTQGAGGDQSPSGEQDDYARLESLGDRAGPVLHGLWSQIPTSAEPLTLESGARSISTAHQDMQVTRNGRVLRYAAPDPAAIPDDEIYDADGQIASPIDEFNAPLGGAFCGSGNFSFPGGGLSSTVEPYSNCVEVGFMSSLIATFFEIPDEEFPLPMPDSLRAGTGASHLGGLLVTDEQGQTSTGDVLFGYLPGEATSLYVEQFRRRSRDELGYDHAVMLSYAQDHEGYLMIPEDWLLGEYESDIAIWGPLQGEHIMEGVFNLADEVFTTDVREPADPDGLYPRTVYPVRDLPGEVPDSTPNAGTRLLMEPQCSIADPDDDTCGVLFTPIDIPLELDVSPTVPRAQGMVQLAWLGGDPGVDEPLVHVERQGPNGAWEPLTTHAGRPITSHLHDIIVTHTPDPLYPVTAEQQHWWWAAWQPVGHFHDRMGLPEGTYRLVVSGQHFTGSETQWPWTTTGYTVESDPFEVVAATLELTQEGADLLVSLPAHDAGFRYLAAGGDSRGSNPPVGPFTVRVTTPTGVEETVVEGTLEGDRVRLSAQVPAEATSAEVLDSYLNVGLTTL